MTLTSIGLQPWLSKQGLLSLQTEVVAAHMRMICVDDPKASSISAVIIQDMYETLEKAASMLNGGFLAHVSDPGYV